MERVCSLVLHQGPAQTSLPFRNLKIRVPMEGLESVVGPSLITVALDYFPEMETTPGGLSLWTRLPSKQERIVLIERR
jgi:hypothetical protein